MKGGASDGASAKAAAFDLHPQAMLIVDAENRLTLANEAALDLFGPAFSLLARGRLDEGLAPASALPALADRCRQTETWVRDRTLTTEPLGQPAFEADVHAAPLGEGAVLLSLRRCGSQFGEDTGHEAPGLHSAAGLARMLAHEIKNPLAGIRGAAQLLKQGATVNDVPLAQLIVDETDRIHRLVERMSAFSEDAPLSSGPVNIHRVLDRVRTLAASSWVDALTVRETYDPSLPPAWGDEDQLIQLFLNLVKNAVEAALSRQDGAAEIAISTAYRHGSHLRTGQDGRRRDAPLEVRIGDNGPGPPAAVRNHMFEPFVTTKQSGAGLGLTLVARIAAAHGGRVDFESSPGRTVFRVLLPVRPPIRPSHELDPSMKSL